MLPSRKPLSRSIINGGKFPHILFIGAKKIPKIIVMNPPLNAPRFNGGSRLVQNVIGIKAS